MLLKCENLRIDRGGVPLLEGLNLEVDAKRTALVGDFTPLFAVLSGVAEVAEGNFLVGGGEVREEVIRGRLGLVLTEPLGDRRWTVLELLTKSALLAGLSKAGAKRQSLTVLERLHLGAFGRRALASLGSAEMVAVGIAHAMLTEPKVIAAEAPFRNLGHAELEWLYGLLERAAEERQLLVSFDLPMLESRRLIGEFDQMVYLHASRLVAVGRPDALLRSGTYLVSVTREGARFRRELEAQGCQVKSSALDDESPAQLLVSGAVHTRADQDPPEQNVARVIARTATQQLIPLIELLPLNAEPVDSVGSEAIRAM